MYGLIWRLLPGPGIVKFILTLLLIGAVAYGLWFYAFPWADPYLPFNDVTVEGSGGGGNDPGYDTGGEDDIVGVDVPVDGESGSGEGEESNTSE